MENAFQQFQLPNRDSAVPRSSKRILILSEFMALLFFIAASSADGPKRFSASLGINEGFGLSMAKVLSDSPLFSMSEPLYHLAIGAEISGNYRLNDRYSLSIRNAAFLSQPGLTPLLIDNVFVQGTRFFSNSSGGLFSGIGAGIISLSYPSDDYWNEKYGGWGPSLCLFLGYRFTNRFEILAENRTGFPRNGQRYAVVKDSNDIQGLQYIYNDFIFTVRYDFF